MDPLPSKARFFITALAMAALALLVVSVVRGASTYSLFDLVCLAALYVISDSIGARGTRDTATIALGSVSAMAALPLLGGWGAIVLACSTALANDSRPLVKRVFNTAQLILTAGAAALAYYLLGGAHIQRGSFPGLMWPFLAALSVHCVINGLLVAAIVRLANDVPMRVVWQGTLAKSTPGYVGYGLFGLLLAVLWAPDGADVGPMAALLVLLPLFVAKWAYQQYAEEQRAYDRTVRTLVAAVETKDVYTRGHSERVSAASVMIARVIGMREDRVTSLRYAGMLHDVGKLGVPTRVLQKSGRLTEEEFAAIQLHPVRGLEMIREIEFLDEAFAGIMHHHERLDGLGYPMGLQGHDIPEFARAIAVADAFDSMTTTRSYRGARSVQDALAELRRCAGTQFDPVMVEALVAAVEEHGWESEAEPLFDPCEEPVRQSACGMPVQRGFDHDDPVAQPVVEPAT